MIGAKYDYSASFASRVADGVIAAKSELADLIYREAR